MPAVEAAHFVERGLVGGVDAEVTKDVGCGLIEDDDGHFIDVTAELPG